VTGRVEADVIETTEIFTTRRGRLERGDGYPPAAERYEAARIDLGHVLGRHVAAVREA
jgi:pilus assembly protein CpaF